MKQPSLAELLAGVMLGNTPIAHGAAAGITETKMWPHALRLSMLWRCLPRLRKRLLELNVHLSDDESRLLTSFSAAAAVESAMICRGATRAFVALGRAGVRAACFKGLGMIGSVYHRPSERMLNDADFLVQQADLPAAAAALRDAGFAPAVEMELDAWISLLDERVYPLHDFLDFVDRDGVRIDLHWSFSFGGEGFSMGDILDRSLEANLAGERVRVVSAEDSIVLSANHVIRDRLAPFSAVKDLVDIEAMLGGTAGDADTLFKRARDAGLATSLLACLRILVPYVPDGGAAVAAARGIQLSTRKEILAAERLAALFKLQLRRGTVNDLVIGIAGATPSLAGRFIVSRLRMLTDADYRQHKFPGNHRPGTGARTRAFFRDMLTLTPARFSQYRTLAKETRRQLTSMTD